MQLHDLFNLIPFYTCTFFIYKKYFNDHHDMIMMVFSRKRKDLSLSEAFINFPFVSVTIIE